MTEFLKIGDGRIAYDVTGQGPLVVLSHGLGDDRRGWRFLVPVLVEAGFRVATPDMRGHGESTTGWASYSRTDVAGDLLELIRHLGGPAAIVGHSFSGGGATIAAATEPGLVRAIAEIGSFTRAQKIDLGALVRNGRYRKGVSLLLSTALFRSPGLLKRYLDHAYPGVRPGDYDTFTASLLADLRRPGRAAVITKMGMSAPTDAGARLGDVRCPALIINGTLDPDWPDAAAEAAGVVAALPEGLGRVVMIDGAGHYPHAQFPAEVAAALLPFLNEHARG
ncbi:alpha/beta hydrolase [Microbispora sp. RL4-1S]|uniref:Alpha/beta hydrolase n=1 Tax=Microbispora oryzae TaxID=2806554 RepID=A0A941AHV5_9ACTN|nr:alpha/beta hydrolase [Microbispora oryzae]MBP2703137.1 alpha/beta hydrolase [Microbispora oryzae]